MSVKFHIHKKFVILVSILLVSAIVVLGLAFVSAYKKVAPGRIINSDRVSRLVKEPAMLGLNDVSSISSWMTFDYINHVFGLPSPYLKSALSINDSRYPELSLSRYAKDTSVDASTFTTEVQSAVGNYLKTSSLQ